MKLPCELIVFEILPTARGELARELVREHGLTQAKVATLFGVTSAAISQYIKGLRGGNQYIDSSRFADVFHVKICESAENMMNGSDLTTELCLLCLFVKQTGMLDEIYAMQGAKTMLTECLECPKDNFNPVPALPRRDTPRSA